MNKSLNIAIILTAYDKATRVINSAVAQSEQKLRDMKKASQAAFGQGAAFTGAGMAILAATKPAVAAFMELEDAQTSLKSSMMMAGGKVAEEFEAIDKLAIKLGNRLPGTTRDFYQMFEVMLNQGIPAKTILDGVGESAAYLAVGLKLPYEEAAKMAAKLKEATGTANEDMMKFMDTIARTKNMGVDTQEMQYAFGRSAGALKLMSVQGLEASKSIAGVYAMLIRTGVSGETVGTGMASIFNNMLNGDKMAKANAEAAKLGVHLEFIDKQGNFKGVENMIAQLDQLGKFSAEKRASVINALTGGGQDAQMLQTLITQGVDGYNKIQRGMAKQATLNDKVTSQLGTLSNVWEATTGTITNMMASIGKAIGPELKKIAELMGKAAEAFGSFMEHNPKLAKFIALTVLATGVLLTVVGVIKLIRGAMIALNVVMTMNPFILVAMAAIAAVALIYSYWDDIVGFFSDLWKDIKQVFFGAINFIKELFLNFTPIGLIIKHWDSIVQYFKDLWERVKSTFKEFMEYVLSIPSRMYHAGEEMMNQLWEGIKAQAYKPVQAIKDTVKEMRDYFPFSPAKVGPLRDLHKVKIVETIAGGIKSAPLVNAMDSVLNATMNAANRPVYATAGGGGGRGVNVHYAPQISFNGPVSGQDKMDFERMLRTHKRQLRNIFEEVYKEKERTKY